MATKSKNRILTVSVRSNIEVGRFQHVHIEAQVAVGAGQTPESAIQDGLNFVAEQLKLAKNGKTVVTPFLDRLKEISTRKCLVHPRFELGCYNCKHGSEF